MPSSAATVLREVRARHALSQQALAQRARTSQRQISRLERGETSPSVQTLQRLLAVMGERLDLSANAPRDNRSDEELQADYRELTASERVAQMSALSRTLTSIAAAR